MTPQNASWKVHLSGYQARDREVVDYRMHRLDGTDLWFRGQPPASGTPGSYFACLGAAQTFGCFCEAPYPELLSRGLGLPALNLGYGGAGPEFFARRKDLLPWINGARFVVLQVMSGRSQSNSWYECGGLEYVTLRRGSERMGAGEAFTRLMAGPPVLARLPVLGPGLARRMVRPRVRRIVAEIRANWQASMIALLDRIAVPVVLLWFSKRQPDYSEEYGSPRKLLGEFPHLVTPRMLEAVQARVAVYVECVTARGSPQPLFSRFSGCPVTVETAHDRPDLAGRPWTHNAYYPSPEMHEDAAAALLDPCRHLLETG